MYLIDCFSLYQHYSTNVMEATKFESFPCRPSQFIDCNSGVCGKGANKTGIITVNFTIHLFLTYRWMNWQNILRENYKAGWRLNADFYTLAPPPSVVDIISYIAASGESCGTTAGKKRRRCPSVDKHFFSCLTGVEGG